MIVDSQRRKAMKNDKADGVGLIRFVAAFQRSVESFVESKSLTGDDRRLRCYMV